MASDWTRANFADAIDFQEGPGILARDFRPSGVPLIRLAGLDPGGSVLDGCNFLDAEAVRRKWSHFSLAKGDVLLSTSASLGRIAVVDEAAVGAIPYTGIIRMRPRDSRLLGPFIPYLLEGANFQQQAEAFGVGSVIRHFGPTHLRQMTLLLPPGSEQRAIAAILGAFDDKIDLNRRMSETLEAIARALFKSWFVDFDPVRAKAEGRDPGLPKEIADLFPASFEDSELGEIPKGWRAATAAELAYVNPESWKAGRRPGIIRYLDLSNVKWGKTESPAILHGEAAPSRAQRVLRAGDTIVGTVRPGNGSYALVQEDGLTGSTGFAVLRPVDARDGALVYLAATQRQAIETLAHLADGGAYPAVRPESVAATPVALPAAPTTQAFSALASPPLARKFASENESRTLAAIRDALLPKLISGEIRVKDAEKAAAAAL